MRISKIAVLAVGLPLLAVVAVPLVVLLGLAAGIWNGMNWLLQEKRG